MTNSVKTFLFKIAILACFIIVADFVGGLALKHLFYKQRSGKYFTTTHALTGCKEDVIVFGSSHAAQHFNAPLMEKQLDKTIFNFGNQGQSLLYTYPLVKSILSYHQPQLVVLNVDYDELRYTPADYDRLTIFLPYDHLNPFVDSAISIIPDHAAIKANSALYRYNSTIGYILLNTYNHTYNKSVESKGYDPTEGNMCSPLKQNGDKLAGQQIYIDENKVNCLIKLVTAIRARHVRLLVTTSPMLNYRGENEFFKKRLVGILTQMQVDYLDYGINAAFKNKCEKFNDESHLNPAGAAEWSAICSNYIKSRILGAVK